MRSLIEQGLRHTLNNYHDSPRFKLRKASYKGKGLQAGVKNLSWQRLQEIIYEGRGS